jgi:hypothetical protein
MTATTFAVTGADIPDGALDGHQGNGWRAPHWYGPGFTPAGTSTWTTAEDMVRFATAVLAGKAPGMAALEPEAEARTGEIGLAWLTSDVDGREITWHNGNTGGMHTILALDRERQQAVVLLGNTSHPADRAGLALAASDGTVAARDSLGIPSIPTVAATFAGMWFLIIFATAAVRGWDRLGVASGLLAGAAGLLILLAHGPWLFVPAWVWSPLAGVCVALAGYGVLRSMYLPIWPGPRQLHNPLEAPKRSWRRRVQGVLSAVANLIVLSCVMWSL